MRISEARTARLLIPVTPDEHHRVKVKATEAGISMSEAARRLLLAWADGDMLLPGIEAMVYSSDAATDGIRPRYDVNYKTVYIIDDEE